MSPELHARVLEILREVLELLRQPECDVSWSHYDSAAEAVADWEAHLQRIERNDFSQQRALERLFGPNGALQEIAESNGWSKRFLMLAHHFDCCIAGDEEE